MLLNSIHQKSFVTRLEVTDNYTNALMQALKDKGHFTSFRKATLQEDKDGIDWWVKYPKERIEVPIQFKLRDKQKDVPVVRYQPFYGIDSEKTQEGRDWRCVKEIKSQQYYVAVRTGAGIFSEVYRVPCEILRSLIIELDKQWNEVTGRFENYAPKIFNKNIVNVWLEKGIRNKLVFSNDTGCQVWWKKNFNEKYPKFNMYVPYSYNDWSLALNETNVEKMACND